MNQKRFNQLWDGAMGGPDHVKKTVDPGSSERLHQAIRRASLRSSRTSLALRQEAYTQAEAVDAERSALMEDREMLRRLLQDNQARIAALDRVTSLYPAARTDSSDKIEISWDLPTGRYEKWLIRIGFLFLGASLGYLVAILYIRSAYV